MRRRDFTSEREFANGFRESTPVSIVGMPASTRQRAIACSIVLAMAIGLVPAVWFANAEVARVDAFVPVLQTVICIADLLTAYFLFAQYSIEPRLTLLALASGYMFTGLFALLQSLEFPGAYSANGLLGGGLSGAAWLFVFWQMTFFSAVILYLLLGAAVREESARKFAPFDIVATVAAVVSIVGILTWLGTSGSGYLPNLYSDPAHRTVLARQLITPPLLLCIAALGLLLLRTRTLLDLCLIVTLCAALPILAQVFFFSRFSVVWYVARCYTLIASCIVLAMLLTETTMLYRGLSSAMLAQRRVRRAETSLRESEARLQAAVDLVKLGRYSLDPQTSEFQWDDTVRAMWGLPPGAPVSYEVWRSGVHPDDLRRVEPAIRERLGQAIREGIGSDGSVVSDFEYRVIGIADRVERWIAVRSRISFENGKPIALFGVALDVTERKRSEQANLLLIAELQHRTRNLLAVVSGISTQTLAASNSLADFSAVFGDRLAALSRVQGLLSASDVKPITIGELVRTELQALGAAPDGQSVLVQGPEVTLPSKSVQVLALALHELATNARKHGALAGPEGRLTVTWRTTNNHLERSLVIEWREHCAAADGERALSKRKGFGRKLIEEALPYQLDAQTRLEFKPEGVFCSVTISLGSRSGAGR